MLRYNKNMAEDTKKSERIKQIKGLIKKYHPDLCYDEKLKQKHTEITIRLNEALTRLLRSAPKAGETDYVYYYAPFQAAPPAEPGDALKPLKDQSYAWYRQGIRYWRRIHPGRFYKKAYISNSSGYFPDHIDVGAGEKAEVIRDIFYSFRQAKYFFTRVLEDYADSPWVFDAKRKLRIMEKLEFIYKQWLQRDLKE
jgi:hypothetical protein